MNENNWIDLNKLPKLGGKHDKIKWNDCYGIDVNFSYEGIKGYIHIIMPIENRKMLIEYKGKEIKISRDSLASCKLQYIVETKTHNFKFNIDDKVYTRYGYLTILEQKYIKKSKNSNPKYLNKGYLVKCSNCGDEFELLEAKLASLSNIDDSIICPICRGNKVKVGFNDMWTTNPEQAAMLLNPNDGYKYTQSANKPKLKWKCQYCGEIIKDKTPNDIRTSGLCCPKCKNTISYPNRFMYCLLNQLTEFEREKSFNWSDGRIYDFYISNKSCIVEMNGIQHYEDSFANMKNYIKKPRTLKEEQKNDQYKENLAKENGIQNYIVIECKKTKFNYIKEKVLNSKISQIFDLNIVDWIKLKHDIETSDVFKVAELWNSGIKEIYKIRTKLNLEPNATTHLLMRAADLELCDYNPDITQKIGRNKVAQYKYQTASKPFKCIESKECFGTMKLCTEHFKLKDLNIDRRLLYKVLKEERSTTNKMHFKYISKEEFNHQKDSNPDMTFGDKFILNEFSDANELNEIISNTN